MKISIIGFTDNGMEIAYKLSNSLSEDNNISFTRCGKGELSIWTEEHFSDSDALIFIGAIGIALRAIAPYIKTKTKDPAVVVVDELGQFSIPILSGHIGGANELALQIADILNAIPVITTATDINNLFAIDTWAKSQGLKILNPECIKLVSSKLLKGETIHIKSDYPIQGNLPKKVQINDLEDSNSDYDVIISHNDYSYMENKDILLLIPSIITIGIGCRKDISFDNIERSVLNILDKENYHILSLNAIASIDKKANEKGILEFARKYNLPFNTYSAEELNSLEGDFTKSEFVKSVVEVDNVCERSAVIESNGNLIRRKDTCDGAGVTVALAMINPILSWD
ncbi:cobalamin biosynthesis protein CbiG [Methanobrevibacter ruminantium M1]|uniref:Cobalamin biosynthesis protein CbiG n=1 Tax=Methanobrevibacter ruminantium (strain ATCC 35063 / DSM 1093 / JCM 13430 / OCM 146 / M1) TaxID=634498 RepID=D3E2H9_METRM|nr:cobalt-precorrin 5A hydrolase [Methanobrevibacter ruminantium]ADC46740.1 cobalamin biosynthesis protein CbiG [Methanobrevibacter ruminantium M1]